MRLESDLQRATKERAVIELLASAAKEEAGNGLLDLDRSVDRRRDRLADALEELRLARELTELLLLLLRVMRGAMREGSCEGSWVSAGCPYT